MYLFRILKKNLYLFLDLSITNSLWVSETKRQDIINAIRNNSINIFICSPHKLKFQNLKMRNNRQYCANPIHKSKVKAKQKDEAIRENILHSNPDLIIPTYSKFCPSCIIDFSKSSKSKRKRNSEIMTPAEDKKLYDLIQKKRKLSNTTLLKIKQPNTQGKPLHFRINPISNGNAVGPKTLRRRSNEIADFTRKIVVGKKKIDEFGQNQISKTL